MEKKRKSRKIKLAVLIIIVTLIIISIIKLSGSSKGVLIASKPLTTTPTPSFNFTPVAVAGKYASFSYPVSLQPFSTQGPSGSTVESYTYRYRDIETWVLAISVNTLHSNSLSQDSGYAYRTLNPSVYKKSVATFGKNQFVIMTDTSAEGFSEVGYSLNGDMSGDISLFGDDTLGTGDLIKTFNIVLASWRWK